MKRKNFTRILNTEFDKEGTVDQWLSKQFTVDYDDGTFGWLFYADKDVTWKALDHIPEDCIVTHSPRTQFVTLNPSQIAVSEEIQTWRDAWVEKAALKWANAVPCETTAEDAPSKPIQPYYTQFLKKKKGV
jgi:hypothetical protein